MTDCDLTEPIGACQCRTCRRDIDQDAVPTVEQARGGHACLTQRMARDDWHGVMDAAADIREIEAGLQILAHARVDEIDTEIGAALRQFMATGRPWVAPIIEDDK